MRKSWLLCVLLGTLAWGQAQPETPPAQSNPATPPGAAAKAPAPAAEVPENAVVLTIKGVCAPAAKTPAAGAKTAAGKTAAAKKPADCKTEITRAQFEKIANGLSPNVTPQLKRQLETALPRFMAMSEIAKEKGLDKTPRFQEMMKIVKMQVLTQELQRSAQEQSDKVTPDEVDKYYKDNAQAFQQYSLDRLFVPRFKQAEPDSKPEGQLSDDERKKKEADDKAKQEQSEQDLTKLADALRARAASGEDFTKLQKEAFEAAGEKVDNPTVNLPKVRRTGLPPAHAVVFDLKVGEVSQVISDNGGHYVYKVVSEEVLPLDQVKDEIHNKLKSESMKAVMDKYNGSFEAIPNEAYFGPPQAPGMHGAPGPHMPHPGRAPMPGSAPPPQANPQSQPPASQPPSN
jgi:hypothetical protein